MKDAKTPPRRRSASSVPAKEAPASQRSAPSVPVAEASRPRPQPPVHIVEDGPVPPRRRSNPPSKGTLLISQAALAKTPARPVIEDTMLLDIPPAASLGHAPALAPPAAVQQSAPPPSQRPSAHTVTPASGVRVAPSVVTTVVVPKAPQRKFGARIGRAARNGLTIRPMLAFWVALLMVGCFLLGIGVALSITHRPFF